MSLHTMVVLSSFFNWLWSYCDYYLVTWFKRQQHQSFKNGVHLEPEAMAIMGSSKSICTSKGLLTVSCSRPIPSWPSALLPKAQRRPESFRVFRIRPLCFLSWNDFYLTIWNEKKCWFLLNDKKSSFFKFLNSSRFHWSKWLEPYFCFKTPLESLVKNGWNWCLFKLANSFQ